MIKKGFTIAELVLVIAIIGILFAIASNTYSNQRQRYDFTNSQQQILSLISTARNYATTSRAAYFGGKMMIPPEGYGVYIEKNAAAGASKVILFANTGTDNNKYDATDVIEETYKIPVVTVFDSLLQPESSTNLSRAVIIFRPPLADVFIGDNDTGDFTALSVGLYLAGTPKTAFPQPDGSTITRIPETAKRYISISKVAGFPELTIPTTP